MVFWRTVLTWRARSCYGSAARSIVMNLQCLLRVGEVRIAADAVNNYFPSLTGENRTNDAFWLWEFQNDQGFICTTNNFNSKEDFHRWVGLCWDIQVPAFWSFYHTIAAHVVPTMTSVSPHLFSGCRCQFGLLIVVRFDNILLFLILYFCLVHSLLLG